MQKNTPTSTPEQVPEQVPEPVPEQIPERVPEQTSEQVPEPVPEPEQIPEQVPEQAPEQSPEPIPEQVPEQSPEQVPEPVPEQVPEQVPEEGPDQENGTIVPVLHPMRNHSFPQPSPMVILPVISLDTSLLKGISSPAVIAGMALALMLFLFFIICCVICCKRRSYVKWPESMRDSLLGVGDVPLAEFPLPGPIDPTMHKGYLKKLDSSGRWSPRWVVVKNKVLSIYKDSKSYWRGNLQLKDSRSKSKPNDKDFNLLLCTIRMVPQFPNTFEIIHSTKGKVVFKADSAHECELWTSVIQRSILAAITTSHELTRKRMSLMPNGAIILQMLTETSNQFCADCDKPDPEFVSLNTGAMICFECSEIHRSFGPSISNVKSLTMDVLHSATANYLLQLPNSLVNKIYEEIPVLYIKKPIPNSDKEERFMWIKKKYYDKAFVKPFPGTRIELHQTLVDSIREENVPEFIKCVAQGANPKPITCDGMHILHLAIEEGLILLVEAMLLSGVDVNVINKSDNKTGIFFAIDEGNIDIVRLLVSGHNAALNVKDIDGFDVLSYAKARAEESPGNPKQLEIYEYLFHKVGRTTQSSSSLGRSSRATHNRVVESSGSGSSKVASPREKVDSPRKQLQVKEVRSPELSSDDDDHHVSISLSDYL